MKTITLIIFLSAIFQVAAQSKYSLQCDSALLAVSEQVALAQAGVLEFSGNNDGEVEKYLRSVGLTNGSPYCAAGQFFCFDAAAKFLNLPEKEIPIPKTGLASAIYYKAKNCGVKQRFKADRHDLIVWRKGKTIFGHIERTIKIEKAGWIRTIAFNVNGNINGKRRHGVFVKRRNIFHPLGRMQIRGIVGFIERKSHD